MKITIVNHEFNETSGQGRVNFELAKFLLKKGFEIQLVAIKVDSQLLRLGAQWTQIKAPFKPTILKYLIFAFIAPYKIDNDSKFIIANGFNFNAPHDLNICHFVHHTWKRQITNLVNLNSLEKLKLRILAFINAKNESRAFRLAKLIIAVSEKTRQELKQIGIPSQKIITIYNGVNIPALKPRKARINRTAIFLGEAKTGRKNLETVLKALALTPKIKLLVVGEIKPFHRVLANKLHITHRVKFTGFTTNNAQWLDKADFFVFPSFYEACPLALMEAAAAGLPSITTKESGLALILKKSCIIIKPNDVDALVRAMVELGNNLSLLIDMSRWARREIKPYTWQRMGQAYLKIIRKLLCSKQSIK